MRSAKQLLALAWAVQATAQSTISGKNLRIQPLGDSITVGSCGSNGNGYRQYLVNSLEGNQVNMVGSSVDGSARDNQYEARPGAYINDIQSFANGSLGSTPNVYLIHAGTNNLFSLTPQTCAPAGTGNSSDICQAAANALSGLLDFLKPTGALLVVAQLTPSLDSSYNSRISVYNQLVATLVNSRKQNGWLIQLANMQSQVTTSDIDDVCDGKSGNIVHPNDGGYKKMASVWYNALVSANNAGLIPNPRTPYGYAQSACSSVMPNQTWCPDVGVYSGRGQANFFYGVQCSDISGTNNCNCNDGGSSNFTQPKTGSCAEMSVSFVTATRWADLNGDGRQENVWISSTGALNVSLNLGVAVFPNLLGCASTQSRFRELGLLNIAPASSTKRYQVYLADLDGDSRAELILVSSNGSAVGYYNTGSPHTLDNTIAINFATSAVQVAPSFGVSGVGVRFADFDGDGRADYVWVSANGALQVWLNRNTGSGANVGSNWSSQGSIGPAVLSGTYRENIIIADIDGDGRADFLIVNRQDGTVGAYLNKPPPSGSKVPNWTWIGAVATAQNGTAAGANQFLAEVNFADPDGDGHYDYLVTNGGDSSVQGLKNRCF